MSFNRFKGNKWILEFYTWPNYQSKVRVKKDHFKHSRIQRASFLYKVKQKLKEVIYHTVIQESKQEAVLSKYDPEEMKTTRKGGKREREDQQREGLNSSSLEESHLSCKIQLSKITFPSQWGFIHTTQL